VVIYPCSENIFDPKKFMGVGANDPMHFRTLLEIPRNAKVFLTVARIDISKGYKVQLEVINNLRKQDEKLFENLHWFWVGNGADYYQLSGILQDTALNTNVHMFGQIDRDLLPSIYASSDVFVLPSFCEGTPLVLLEAIAMELPIIATKVDGVKEILTEETAFLLDDPSKQPINDMLEYAYRLFSTDNVVTKKYKENIKKERERCQHNPNWRYTEEVFIQRFLNVLKGVGI
jgi:glycosyltransferase involved in cell wall biosynthesis